jgi:hypothetical protein
MDRSAVMSAPISHRQATVVVQGSHPGWLVLELQTKNLRVAGASPAGVELIVARAKIAAATDLPNTSGSAKSGRKREVRNESTWISLHEHHL